MKVECAYHIYDRPGKGREVRGDTPGDTPPGDYPPIRTESGVRVSVSFQIFSGVISGGGNLIYPEVSHSFK